MGSNYLSSHPLIALATVPSSPPLIPSVYLECVLPSALLPPALRLLTLGILHMSPQSKTKATQRRLLAASSILEGIHGIPPPIESVANILLPKFV